MRLLVPLVFSNSKEVIRQPFYSIIFISGSFLVLMSFSFTFFAFGEEGKMIRDMGVSTITIGGLLVACLSSSVLVAKEFESKTALAILSTPVSRAYFILGKYLGIMAVAALLIISQGVILEIALIVNNYSKIPDNQSDIFFFYDYGCLLGVYFSLLQVFILGAVSLALSIYLNTVANLTISLFFFILCHTVSYILPLHSQCNYFVSAVTVVCYILFPSFQNMIAVHEIADTSGITGQKEIIAQYIVYLTAYTTLYCVSILSLAVFLFRNKEIA